MTRPAAPRTVSVAVLVALALLALTGCDELSARRLVQKGNLDYSEQRYEEAAAKFERAIAKAPDLDIAHHNLAITYARLFKPGLDTAENKQMADKAANHFAIWLEKHPNDDKIRRLLTSLWIDAGDYPRAIEFWKKQYEKTPKARDVIQLIGGIYLKSGDWYTALEWYEKDIEAAVDNPGKVAAYYTIATLTFNKLYSNREKIFGTERTQIAEIGLAATDAGLKLDDKNIAMWSIAAALWKHHAMANGPAWAQQIDFAEAQVFDQRARVLKEEAKKAQAATGAAGTTPSATPSPAPPGPAAPGNGT